MGADGQRGCVRVGAGALPGGHADVDVASLWFWSWGTRSWPSTGISGRHTQIDPAFFSPYCPLQNVTAGYPPTMLVHGDCDDGVPHEQAAMMADELARNKVPTELVTIAGGTHSFDRIGPPAQARYAYGRVSAFLGQHLNGDAQHPRYQRQGCRPSTAAMDADPATRRIPRPQDQ